MFHSTEEDEEVTLPLAGYICPSHASELHTLFNANATKANSFLPFTIT